MNSPSKGLDLRISRVKWIGLARVKPLPGNSVLGEATGAFVASIALADQLEAYIESVTEALSDDGFEVLEIEDIEPYEERAGKYPVTPAIRELAEQVNEDNPVRFATFHTFKA